MIHVHRVRQEIADLDIQLRHTNKETSFGKQRFNALTATRTILSEELKLSLRYANRYNNLIENIEFWICSKIK